MLTLGSLLLRLLDSTYCIWSDKSSGHRVSKVYLIMTPEQRATSTLDKDPTRSIPQSRVFADPLTEQVLWRPPERPERRSCRQPQRW